MNEMTEFQQRAAANAALEEINQFLPQRLNARLNPAKTVLQPIERGIDFVGHVIKPWHRTTRRRTVNEALSRSAATPDDRLFETANSYFGLLRQASHSHHDRARLANALRRRGNTITFAPRPSGCETGHPSLSFAFGHAAANSFCPDTSRVRFALLGDSTAPEGLSGASRHRAARYPCLVA